MTEPDGRATDEPESRRVPAADHVGHPLGAAGSHWVGPMNQPAPGSSAAVGFPIRLQPGLRPILLLFGVRPDRATVRLDSERLVARFGFFGAETPLANIVGWDITGPYRWWRAVGVRRTLGTHDLSFGGSAHGGLCVHFREAVRVGRLSVTDLYLTVDDLDALGVALTAAGIEGHDLRTRP